MEKESRVMNYGRLRFGVNGMENICVRIGNDRKNVTIKSTGECVKIKDIPTNNQIPT